MRNTPMKTLALASGIALLFAASLASAAPPRAQRSHVTVITPVKIYGRQARPQAVQEISRVDWPFSRDRIGPTLVARIGKAVTRRPF